MGSDQNNNSGCLFPFGDDFLPIFMFFFHLNQADSSATQFDEDNEDDDQELVV
jgi:hypothetical protein